MVEVDTLVLWPPGPPPIEEDEEKEEETPPPPPAPPPPLPICANALSKSPKPPNPKPPPPPPPPAIPPPIIPMLPNIASNGSVWRRRARAPAEEEEDEEEDEDEEALAKLWPRLPSTRPLPTPRANWRACHAGMPDARAPANDVALSKAAAAAASLAAL